MESDDNSLPPIRKFDLSVIMVLILSETFNNLHYVGKLTKRQRCKAIGLGETMTAGFIDN
jgi:hypothetical protein